MAQQETGDGAASGLEASPECSGGLERRRPKRRREEEKGEGHKGIKRTTIRSVCECGCHDGVTHIDMDADMMRLLVRCPCQHCGPVREDGSRRCIIELVPLISNFCEDCQNCAWLATGGDQPLRAWAASGEALEEPHTSSKSAPTSPPW